MSFWSIDVFELRLMAMRAGIALVVSVCGLAMTLNSAGAQTTASDVPIGFYIGIGAGGTMPTNASALVSKAAKDTPTPLTFRGGYKIVGAAGLKWNSNIRSELEFGFRNAEVHHFAGVGASGSQGIINFGANVLYDMNLSAPASPYFGVGLGMAHSHWGNVNAGAASDNFSGNNMTLQWQLIGGLNVPLGGTTYLFTDYRYIGVSATTFNGSAGQVLHGYNDHSHNVLAGLRFFL